MPPVSWALSTGTAGELTYADHFLDPDTNEWLTLDQCAELAA
jgi:hypothetical protein